MLLYKRRSLSPLLVIPLFFLWNWGGTGAPLRAGQVVQGAKNTTDSPTAAIPLKNGITVNVAAESPTEKDTLLAVLYFFEPDEGEQLAGAKKEIDRRLHGVMQGLRQRRRFTAHPLETLVIAPLPYSIRPRQLLLIGLGKREKLSPELLRDAGSVALREALRLGIRHYAQVLDFSDEPPLSLGTKDVSACLLAGALAAYATEQELQDSGLADVRNITGITCLTSLAEYAETVRGIKEAIAKTPLRSN